MPAERPRYEAVLLDWRGIIAHCPPTRWWIERALASIDRPVEPSVVDEFLARVAEVESTAAYRADELRVDTSVEVHRSVVMGRMRDAGIDDELAEAIYRLECDPSFNEMYPDVPEVLRAIRDRGCRMALVSDFHVDLRPELESRGIAAFFEAIVISFEHGFQKPDPRMFEAALGALGSEPAEALMVGDRASHDGGAAELGIDTLLLPALEEFGPRGLDRVLGMLDRVTVP